MEFHRSAFKHGIRVEAITHALGKQLVAVDLDVDGGRDEMTDRRIHRTASGRVLTDDDIDAIAAQVETGVFDVEVLKSRRRGRPMIGSAPAEVVPVRIDPELKAAIDARAVADETTTSEVIREALRRYLEVA